ncbi:MarR family transcriptional regulator [Romeria aff. gracilis LEGE 07310]|uniref:MarR family transcriptional regulator n=1 Tax=Vasconcelosia minhoensis LEGE 07310 TaxID=915328 RepID=A0A8J7DB81_9CYAN|nr:MarR family transcriptional regulator [Romeria gracilis]MBE9075998.1 MarR family transcriptional regulator [Romeria aff. gracilis LEGE 07310]
MADSQSLRLVFASATLHSRFTEYVAECLHSRGFSAISPSTLDFLSALDCGINYGAEIARRLQVSRQMVSKTVKELCQVGYLEQREGVGKQKQILFTEQGERLMSMARLVLADLDQVFIERFSEAQVGEIISQLEALTSLLTTDKELG